MKKITHSNKLGLLGLSSLLVLGVACSSSPSTPTPVAPAEAEVAQNPTAAKSVDGAEAAAPSDTDSLLEEVKDDTLVPSPENSAAPSGTAAFETARQKLKDLGYVGVGLEHEDAEILTLLVDVFSHPDAAKRKIKRVYTGGSMEYDPKGQGFTVGGTTDKAKILNFIRKKIPKR